MDWDLLAEAIGWAAAAATFTAFSMRTMVPLRLAAIASNLLFITYGAVAGVHPVLALHLALLPFNLVRLCEILRAARDARQRIPGDPTLDLLRASMRPRFCPAGTELFRKGDVAHQLYVVESGRVRLVELDREIASGALFGEIAFFSPDRRRTLSAVCETDCRLLTLDEAGFIAAFYRHPELGLAVNRLVTERLLEGMREAPDAYHTPQPAQAAAE